MCVQDHYRTLGHAALDTQASILRRLLAVII